MSDVLEDFIQPYTDRADTEGAFRDLLNLGSNHSGGVNCLMGDGSVKFIKDSISRNTWWALGERANGEVVSADSY